MESLIKKNIIYIELILIFFLSSFVMFYNLDKGSLADWDEAVYAEVSKEILETKDYLTLHNKYFGIKPWPQQIYKPPLLFYLVSVVFNLFGISTLTARILPAIFGIGTILITFLIAKELFNHKVAFMSSLILITAPQFLHYSRMLMLDVPVTFFIAISIYFFILTQKRDNRYTYHLFGLFLGLGFMIKGVVGLIPIFIISIYLLLTKNIKSVINKKYLKTILVFILIVAPWYVIQLILNKSNFLYIFYNEIILRRVASAIDIHDYGNLFYLYVIKNGLNYWFYPLILSILFLIFKLKDNKRYLLILSYIISILSIFLIAKTKLPWYLIPVYPAFAIIIANLFDNLKIKKIKFGFISFIIIFLFSFHIHEPFYCNNALNNINLISEGDIRVHDSIKYSPGEVFYVGVKRYSDDELFKIGNFYLVKDSSYYKFMNYNKIYEEGGYILFTKENYKINKELLKIPENQEQPVRYCYNYMPSNLGYSNL